MSACDGDLVGSAAAGGGVAAGGGEAPPFFHAPLCSPSEPTSRQLPRSPPLTACARAVTSPSPATAAQVRLPINCQRVQPVKYWKWKEAGLEREGGMIAMEKLEQGWLE